MFGTLVFLGLVHLSLGNLLGLKVWLMSEHPSKPETLTKSVPFVDFIESRQALRNSSLFPRPESPKSSPEPKVIPEAFFTALKKPGIKDWIMSRLVPDLEALRPVPRNVPDLGFECNKNRTVLDMIKSRPIPDYKNMPLTPRFEEYMNYTLHNYTQEYLNHSRPIPESKIRSFPSSARLIPETSRSMVILTKLPIPDIESPQDLSKKLIPGVKHLNDVPKRLI